MTITTISNGRYRLNWAVPDMCRSNDSFMSRAETVNQIRPATAQASINNYSHTSFIVDSIYRKLINEINPDEARLIALKRVEMREQEKKVSDICTRLKSEWINIELKNHTIEKQINKLQEELKASTGIIEQAKIRKSIILLEKQKEENEQQMVNGKQQLLEAEDELSTLKEELLSMEQQLYDQQKEV